MRGSLDTIRKGSEKLGVGAATTKPRRALQKRDAYHKMVISSHPDAVSAAVRHAIV